MNKIELIIPKIIILYFLDNIILTKLLKKIIYNHILKIRLLKIKNIKQLEINKNLKLNLGNKNRIKTSEI